MGLNPEHRLVGGRRDNDREREEWEGREEGVRQIITIFTCTLQRNQVKAGNPHLHTS